jgi:hypothetical protein
MTRFGDTGAVRRLRIAHQERTMNEDDLRRIEARLGHPLPRAFRHVMLNFPQELIAAATMTDPDGGEFRDEMMISPDAEAILAGILDREPGWPETFVVVGANGCGEVYSVDIGDEACPVYESGPHNMAGAAGPDEEGYFEQVSDALEGWVRHLVDQIR